MQRTNSASYRTCGAIERSRHVLPLEPAAAHTAGPPIPFTFKTLKTNVKNALESYHFLTAGKVNRCKKMECHKYVVNLCNFKMKTINIGAQIRVVYLYITFASVYPVGFDFFFKCFGISHYNLL